MPPPMHHNNWDYPGQSCFLWEDIKGMVSEANGFTFTDEGRGKWGMLADVPGSTLVLKVNAVLPHESMRAEGVPATVGARDAQGTRCAFWPAVRRRWAALPAASVLLNRLVGSIRGVALGSGHRAVGAVSEQPLPLAEPGRDVLHVGAVTC